LIPIFSFRVDDCHELRLLRPSDADELFRLTDNNREYLTSWLPWLDSTIAVTNTEAFIRSTLQQFADNRGFVAAICYDKTIAGVIGYNQVDWQNRIGYIGCWRAQDSQGKGLEYLTSTVQSLLVPLRIHVVEQFLSASVLSMKALLVIQSGYVITLSIMKSMYNFIATGIVKIRDNRTIPYVRRNINDEISASGLSVGTYVTWRFRVFV
jgi:hypothetical protein